jgi:hypothetical protein
MYANHWLNLPTPHDLQTQKRPVFPFRTTDIFENTREEQYINEF